MYQVGEFIRGMARGSVYIGGAAVMIAQVVIIAHFVIKYW